MKELPDGFYVDDLWFPLSDIDFDKQIVYSDVYGKRWDWLFDEVDYFVDEDDNTVELIY